MSGTANAPQDAATSLIIDTMYRLTQAMVSDTERAITAGKDVMLKRAIEKALQQKNDDGLGMVLAKCYDMDDSVAMELFNSFVERYSTVRSVVNQSGQESTSHLFVVPVTLARMNNAVQPVFNKGAAYDGFVQSISQLLPRGIGPADVYLSDYLYHPTELQDIDPSDLFTMHQALIDNSANNHPADVVQTLLCRSGWPHLEEPYDAMTVELFFMIGSIVLKEEAEDPFMDIPEEERVTWRGDSAELLEACLDIPKDEGFAVIGDIDMYHHGLRNGAIDHKEFSFELEVENVIMRDKFPPQALSILITQFGEDEIVSQVHVSIVSILDNVVRSGFVYGLETFESTDDVIDNMIDTLKDWDISRIKVMDTILPIENAVQDGEPLFLIPEQTDIIAPVIVIDGRKERLLH